MYLPGGGRPAPPVPAHLNTCDSADSLGTEHGSDCLPSLSALRSERASDRETVFHSRALATACKLRLFKG